MKTSEQIARDIREGTFPEKSPMTLLEERIAKLEAALREIAIYDANITKTLREVLK